MPRLSHLQPLVASLAPAVSTQRDDQGHSRQAEPLRHLYSTARWKRLRLRVFVRDLFTCQLVGCGRLEGDTSRLVCDHKIPHRGDLTLFWAETNLQTLCKPCHDRAKQAAERRGVGGSKV
jgi:5-methylcytosine-specific restriction protein A